MKIAICDYKEPLNRDLDLERRFFTEALGENTQVEVYEHHGDNEALKNAIKDADGVLTSYLEFPKDVIESAPNLKGISIEATGYNYVDADAAQRHGTAVAVIGEYCTQEVATHTIALVLAVARSLKHYDRQIEYRHSYDWNSTSGMIRLDDSTLGIMGLGKIGRAVAHRAQAFGLTVIAYDPYCPPQAAADAGVRLVSKEELLRTSDIITLNMLLTPENEHILDDNAFSMMQRRLVIVNVSRGQLIDEAALVRALDSGRIFGAGLDVLEDESDAGVAASPLVGRDNVILTPHSAFYSDKALYECQRIACQNLIHILRGEGDDVFRMVNDVDVSVNSR